ncbi:MAG: hypothetical protein OIN86_10305 [Candidatus Methanoperedens sp.]|nr:hypothetical protein [Candidatus Methanoperedens sp.]CAG0971303.1 hypothetical protein METP1_01257 [Methanosarcinales archaeon]
MVKTTIRRKVLNMPMEMWDKLDKIYPGESFETSAEEFLEKIGLPGALSAYWNIAERMFFEDIYVIANTRSKARRC